MDAAPVVIRRPSRPIPRSPCPHLRDFSRSELTEWVTKQLGGPPFRARQLFQWLHRHRVVDFAAMSNLPARDREQLQELARISPLQLGADHRARDGTRKLRFRTHDDQAIESVLIPNPGRGLTQCISSMVGCSLTCRFCATASLGFVRNLATWEIVDQVYRAQTMLQTTDASDALTPRITNVVFMGMGEPLHNFNQVQRALQLLTDPEGAAISGRRITVSTAGLVPGIERFAREGLGDEIGLAISLNATTDEVRSRIMPINHRWSISELLQAVRRCPTPRRRLITFEYVLLSEINDTVADADRLASLLEDLDSQVNVIPFNPHPHAPFSAPSERDVEQFVERCRTHGLRVFVRTPRGEDIAAACGQLALEGKS